MKTLLSLLFSLPLTAGVLDNFQTGLFKDFSTHSSQVQSASVPGGFRYEHVNGTSPYIAGVSGGYFAFGANAGSFSYTLAYGSVFGGPRLGLSLGPTQSIVVGTEYGYLNAPVRASVTVFTDSTHWSVSPSQNLTIPGDHLYPSSFFRGSADLNHINGISINFLPVVVPQGQTLGMTLEEVAIE